MNEKSVKVNYKFRTIIDIPRAALTTDKVTEYIKFFSFGTNDLTQMTFRYSRDDVEGKDYLSCSPFRISQAKFAAAQAIFENR